MNEIINFNLATFFFHQHESNFKTKELLSLLFISVRKKNHMLNKKIMGST